MSYKKLESINMLNLPSAVIGDTLINIVYYEVDKDSRDIYNGRNHYYEIRFSSAKEDECWIGDYEIAYTLKEAVKLWNIMRQELIDEQIERETNTYLANRLSLLLRIE